MTGAILIIIIVLIVGLALFVLVLLSSSVKEHTSETDDEEISVTYFETKDQQPPVKEEYIPSEQNNPIRAKISILGPMKSLLSRLQQTINTIQTKRAESSNEATKQARIARDKEIQRAVQEREVRSSHSSSKQLTEEPDTSFLEKPTVPKTSPKPRVEIKKTHTPQKKSFSALLDAEDEVVQEEVIEVEESIEVVEEIHEVEIPTEPQKVSPEPVEDKADSFVQGLLSDQVESEYMESVKQPEVDTISDSYYYTYMEKRYIDKIMKNPKDISAYKKLGDLYVEMNNLSDAKESYQVVLKIKPQDDLTRKKLREVEQKILERRK